LAAPEGFIASLEKLIAKFEADKARHDRMVTRLERMLELNKRNHDVAAAFRPPREGVRLKADATDLDREIAATDAETDELVYELYGITEEEQKIIEGAL
jgi:predicted transcriptional regulator